LKRGEADILVGTQMIAKGLDFPNVTLVGVISADTSLNLPDFRACERTFQIISQVAGRAGRGKDPGEVVVQTFDPEQYALQRAVEHDYLGFYELELEMRRELNYPPFSSLVNIMSRDENERTAEARLQELADAIRSGPMADRMGVELMGPIPAVLAKLRGEFRWHLVLRSSNREAMLNLLHKVWAKNPNLRKSLSVDVDPISML
jgi:primosomal protein N' (replication factor Y)